MRTSQSDLHDILFEQLEKLTNPDISTDELKTEIERSKAVCSVSGQILANGKLALETAKFKVDYCTAKEVATLPHFLEEGKGDVNGKE